MSQVQLIVSAETKVKILPSQVHEISPPHHSSLMVERLAIIPGRTLQTTIPLSSSGSDGGEAKLSLPSYLRTLYSRVIDIYIYIYTRTPSTHGKRSDVFITARNALSTEYHFRGTSYHCNEPRFMLKCTRCAHTCHTAPPLTSPPYSAYLLTSPTIRSREISGLMFLWFFARIIVESGQRANFRPVRGRFEQARRREDRISGRTRADDRLAICRSRRSVEEYFATTGMMMTRYTEIIRGEATSHSTFEYLSRVNCLERIRKEDNKITLGINIMARVTEV